jgi:drug/metabolite transporter (DMT)-like permease
LFARPIRPLALSCIAIILLGAGLITVPGVRGDAIDLRGLCWAIPSPLIYAAYLAINSRLLRHYPAVVGAAGLFGGMALSFGVAAAFIGLDWPSTPAVWVMVLFVALGPGALTMSLFAFSVPRLGASGFAILANVELVTVVLIGTLVLGEAVTPGRAVGALLIVTGILAYGVSQKSDYRLPHRRSMPESASVT